LWLRMRKPQPFYVAALFGAVCTMAMSEFFFTLYADVTDIYNLFGHIYKVIAYLFIYHAIFVTTVRRPYRELNASQNRLQSTLNAIPDLLLEVGLDGRLYDCHAPHNNQQAFPDNICLGETIFEVFPPEVAEIGLSSLQKAHQTGYSKGAYKLEEAGERQWFEFSIIRKTVEAGNAPRFIVLSRNVTVRKQSEEALRESEKFLREAQSIANLGSYVLDIRTGLWKNSDVLDRLFGIDETYERTVEGWKALIHPDDRAMMDNYLMNDVFGQGKTFNKEYRIIRHNDRMTRWVHSLGKLTFDAKGSPIEMKGTIQDITEYKEAQDTLHKLSLAVEQSPSSIIITDLYAKIEYVNEAFTKASGYTLDEVLVKNPNILHSGKVSKAIYDDIWAHLTSGETWHGELINKRKDQSEYIESVVISPVRQADGRITNYLAIKEDITEKKRAEERIEYLAHFDQLTGLPNRTMLNDRINYLLNIAKHNNKQLVVMLLDLDHFKNINDTFGRSIGDELLKETAKRLKTAIREEDTVSRLGGDEFVIVVFDTDANGAMHMATKLIETLSKPYHIEQHELIITPSIGIAIYPDDGEDFETLSMNADTAMYRVKQESRNNFRFFTQEMQLNSVRNLQLENSLRLALAHNELEVHYQPQVSMQDGHIIGAEALLRWRHPELGMVSPAEFIPIAEDNGQIIPIGEWVLRTAVKQMKAWMESGLPSMVIAVNLSAVQFHQPELTKLVINILDEEKLPPEHLELELTEAVAMKNPQAAITVMNELHEKGIRMSIDDFGTGYSSLSYLKRFKVYKLKIDQSFVRDIPDNPEDKAIVSAIITMATELGMRTIAEGVETSEQLAFLRLKRCSEVQGYYFSKPLQPEQFAAYVKASIRLAL
ncbi:MAG: EAL domain-containing protein, partial [Thiovulaceae bacterium]|nr:EAL domain-containing protein [Sulfurimonadaceae bacterium]